MKLGVMGALFSQMKFEDALDYCKKVGLDAIELPAGAYPGDPWGLIGLADSKAKVDELKGKVAARGLEIQGIAVHGNPVHPDKALAQEHIRAHREGVKLAQALGTVVINFSGCPAGCKGDKTPNFVTCPWPPEYSQAAEYQWKEVIIPFWKEQNKFAADHGVKIAFEAHPGMVLHNPEDIVRLREAAGEQIGANLDPSHFFWQGIDPVESARYLGEAGCIYHVHAKDCAIDDRSSRCITGNLDIKSYGELKTRAWVFRTVGYGHGDDFWKPFVSMLRRYGYDGVLSIEHEDSLMSANEGFEKTVEYLDIIAPPVRLRRRVEHRARGLAHERQRGLREGCQAYQPDPAPPAHLPGAVVPVTLPGPQAGGVGHWPEVLPRPGPLHCGPQGPVSPTVATPQPEAPNQTTFATPAQTEAIWGSRVFAATAGSTKSQSLVASRKTRTKVRAEHRAHALRPCRRKPAHRRSSPVRILHISDLHLGTVSQARRYGLQLKTDLKQELGIDRLQHFVVSGDLANRATRDDYEAAFILVSELAEHFGLEPNGIIVVPGNHDVNWEISGRAYPFVPSYKLEGPLTEGSYIPTDDSGVLLRNDRLYQQRFLCFDELFYRRVHGGVAYPAASGDQGIIFRYPETNILFLSLNSCWQIDHHYRDRASINTDALCSSLTQLLDGNYANWVKIAVCHHPVTGSEAMHAESLKLLAVHGFQICMHGHVHQPIDDFHRYDQSRGLHVIGAGAVGAPAEERVSATPFGYNLLVLDTSTRTLTVETRKKDSPDSPWEADARWGDKNDPSPRYTIELMAPAWK